MAESLKTMSPQPLYTIQSTDLKATFSPLGATLRTLHVKDKNGQMQNVILGYDTETAYLNDTAYMGCLCGRFANRIQGARFELGGTTHHLSNNEGTNTLHGGTEGFSRKPFSLVSHQSDSITFHLESPDGDQGFPAALSLSVQYSIHNHTTLQMTYHATTKAATHINLTNHAYFNLHGDASLPVLDHVLRVDASEYLETDSHLIPTGKLCPVANTPLDFRIPTFLGDRIRESHPALQNGRGYDLCYPLYHNGNLDVAVAELWSNRSGIRMQCFTTEPAVQLYSGNFLPKPHTGVCLETEHYPDAPHHPHFPSTLLLPGEPYHQITRYAFGTVAE